MILPKRGEGSCGDEETGAPCPYLFWSRRSKTAPTGAESEGQMSHVRPGPAPKPDHIRTLRDLAAGFVRAIDRTALEFEAVATSELTERVACLVTLHEMEATNAELTKTPTKLLRERLNLLRQVGRAEQKSITRHGDRLTANCESGLNTSAKSPPPKPPTLTIRRSPTKC